MVGRALQTAAAARGVPLVCLSRADLDVTVAEQVRASFGDIRPDVVVHLAAYTAVDRAEDELDLAMAVNRDGAANVAAAAREVGARVVFVSTDYVFDGSASRPYRPDDPACPVNAYGRTKWLGEQAVRAADPRNAILRTSWVFAPWGKNFVRTIASRSLQDLELRVVGDQWGRPTSAQDLAVALLLLAEDPSRTGTMHFANAGVTTWYELAASAIALLRDAGREPRARLTEVTTPEYPTRARRPRYSVLDTTRFTEWTKITPRDWRRALADTIEALASEANA